MTESNEIPFVAIGFDGGTTYAVTGENAGHWVEGAPTHAPILERRETPGGDTTSNINNSIQFGYAVEEDWPDKPFTQPLPKDESIWLASWLAGEGVLSRQEAEALRKELDDANDKLGAVRQWADWAYMTYNVIGVTEGTVPGNKLQEILKETDQ